MHFSILAVAPIAGVVQPGDYVYLKYTDRAGIVHKLEQRIYNHVRITSLYVYEHSGRLGVDYTQSHVGGQLQ